jgi:hypothetical protein
MTTSNKCLAIAMTALVLGGCSSAASLLNGRGLGKNAPDENQVSVNQSLAMPPDLNLPAPAQSESNDTAPPPVSAGTADIADVGADPAIDGKAAAAPAPLAQEDLYGKYGISRVKADGTAKSQEELFAELRAAQLAEKRRKNPNYGTIRNLGNIFKDG